MEPIRQRRHGSKMGTEAEPIDISSSSELSSDNETIYEYESDMPSPTRGEFTMRGPGIQGFTKAYLKRYLPLTNDSIIVKVSSPVRTKEYEVSMKLGLGTKKAIITSGWNHVVKRYRLHEKEIVAFSF
ncbi:hypothetical protein ACQ4PT_017771 [Festuca glaucescens]